MRILRFYRILVNVSIKEAIVLVYGLMLDWLHRKLPSNAFVVKNTYDSLIKTGATFKKANRETEISLNSSLYILRRQGSDFAVFNQIVLGNELLPVVNEITGNEKELRIVDCGANIGLSVIYFKERFPNCHIIAVEPNRANFAQLCKNIAINSFEGVSPLNVGVWYEPDMLSANANFRDGSDWAFSLSKSHSDVGTYRVESLKNIVDTHQWKAIDVLKIDIEGAEFELFRNLDAWQTVLDTIRIVSIEIHSEMGNSAEIEKVLIENGFRIIRAGELTIGVRKRL